MMAQVNAGRVRFVGRGEYNNSTQYYVFDLVSYNGNSYYAKVDTIGNLPTDTTYWQLVAEKGNVGPTGLTGNGISSITKTGTSGLVDTYTITFTNGNTTTFDVTNGKGIDRIEKTATVGNIDTYTIYFNDNSTSTFEVANGEVTREELEEEVERLSMIYNAFPSIPGEVEEGSINGTAEVPFKKIGLKGNTSQNGEPTPDTPIPVNVVTGDNSIDVCGKNLIGLGTQLNGYVDQSTLKFQTNPSSIGYYFETSKLPNTITFSSINGNRANVCYFSEIPAQSVVAKLRSSSNDNPRTIAVNKTYPYIHIQFSYSYRDVTNIQIESGSSATTYEPYQSQSYPINLGNIELCRIVDYQDYIYKYSGKWYLNKQIGKVVLDGSENWTYGSAANYQVFYADLIGYLKTQGITCISDYYKAVRNNNGSSDAYSLGNNTISLYYVDGFINRVYIRNDNITSKNDFKTWLSTHNTTVYYVLATPTITEITDTTLIEQLDNLENAYSYDTQTNITQTNDDMPFILDVEAILSLKNIFNS